MTPLKHPELNNIFILADEGGVDKVMVLLLNCFHNIYIIQCTRSLSGDRKKNETSSKTINTCFVWPVFRRMVVVPTPFHSTTLHGVLRKIRGVS